MLDLPHRRRGDRAQCSKKTSRRRVFGEYEKIKEGDEVRRTKRIMSVPVGEALVGPSVDPLGRPLRRPRALIESDLYNRWKRIAPGVMDRAAGCGEPNVYGLKAIDLDGERRARTARLSSATAHRQDRYRKMRSSTRRAGI